MEGQQQLECVCEDEGQTENNHNIQDRSEVSSPVERDPVQFGHNHAGTCKNNNLLWIQLKYSVVYCARF